MRNSIRQGIRDLFPGYFALVMATGIVSIAKEGRLSRNVTEAQIRKHLTSTMDEMTVIVERPGKSPVKKSTQDKKKV